MTTPTLSSTVATSSSSVLFLSLPPYSIPSLPPSYSPDPSPGEECLERTPGVRAHLTGTYIKRCGCDAVGLSDHDLSATIPTYGRNSPIHGFVSLEDRETVSGIVLNIHGRIDVIVSGGGSHTTNLVSKSYTLWSSRTSRGTTTSTCPSVIPFSVSLPSEFRDHHGLPRALPPTSELTFAASRGLFFKTGYMLWVSIARSPSRRFKLLNTRNIISIDFKYAPRVRLSRPIQPVTEFLSDVKMMPEEFRQVVFPLVATSTVTPDMELHLFLPAIEIFDLKEPIPFHVQLIGHVSALREFVLDSSPNDETVTTSTIIGSLVRQVTVDINGHSESRNLVIGHAKMLPRPPGVEPHDQGTAEEATLDWEGELRCCADVMAAAFDAGCVQIQDFVLLELVPHCPLTCSAYVTLSHLHPIQFGVVG